MCDYSLMHVKSRAAQVNDKLVTGPIQAPGYDGAPFDSYTRGVFAEGDNTTAVCLLPGTEIAFAQQPVRFFGVSFRKRDKIATFRQIDKEHPLRHHDAIEFADGTVKLVHDLAVGQKMRVLQLPAQPKTPADAEAQKRLEIVA